MTTSKFTPLRLTFSTQRGELAMLEVESLKHWVVGERYLWQAEAGESENATMHGFAAEQPLSDAEWQALDRHEFPGMESSHVYDVLVNTSDEIILKHPFSTGIVTVTYGDNDGILDMQFQQPS